jgi:YD repeat-containing protein
MKFLVFPGIASLCYIGLLACSRHSFRIGASSPARHFKRVRSFALAFCLILLTAFSTVAYCQAVPATIDFGAINIAGESSPQTVTYTFNVAATLGGVSVLTQGAAGLDFANTTTGTCQLGKVYNVGDSCTVNVVFIPALAGVRYGAAVFADASGNVLGTTYLQGNGTGPQTNFLPGTESVPTTDLFNPACVAVDSSGNIYIADNSNNRVLKETPSLGGYTESVVPTGSLSYPNSVAVDGAGNLYITDSGNNRVLKETLGAVGYAESVVPTSLLNIPVAAQPDGSGNIYIVDYFNNRLLKETLTAGAYVESTVTSTLSYAGNVAIDGNGNVYIADSSNVRVLKETPSGAAYTETTVPIDGLVYPIAVALDGTGNLYIADASGILKETLSGGSYVQSTVPSSAISSPTGVAVDGAGNVYIADIINNRLLKEDFADPPSVSFASAAVGSTSNDSPKTVSVANVGNSTLNFSGVSFPADFAEDTSGSSDCTAGTSLASAASCTLTIDFTPWNPQSQLSEGVTITTNALNVSGTQQTISTTGAELTATPEIFPAPGTYTQGQVVTISDSTPGSVIYFTTDGTTPTTSSSVYNGAIVPGSTVTVQAMAAAAGYSQSAVGSAAFAIIPQVAAPIFSVPSGIYLSSQSVTISESTSGATVYYTTDGTTPTTSSSVYSGAIVVSSSATLNAIATATGYSQSTVATAAYTISAAGSPVLQFRMGATPATVTLPGPSNLDWIVWGADGSTTAATRMVGSSLLSGMTPLNGASITADNNGPIGYSWTGGTPIQTGSSVGAELLTRGANRGFQITAPADTTVKTLQLYVDINPNAKLTVSISDGSSPSIVHTPTASQDAGYEIYSIDYRAASAGQTLTAQLISTDSSAQVGLQAAILQPHLPQVSIVSPLPGQTFVVSGAGTANVPAYVDATQFDAATSSAQVSANGVQVASMSTSPYQTTWTANQGHYVLQAQATDGSGLSNTSAAQEVDVIGGGGSLSDSFGQPSTTPEDLTSEGTADWTLFQPTAYGTTQVTRKSGVAPLISNLTVLGSNQFYQTAAIDNIANDPPQYYLYGVPVSFEDGNPDARESNIVPSVFLCCGSTYPMGYELTVAADTTPRTLRLYGAADGNVQLTAFLSDGSAAPITDSSISNTVGVTGGVYTINYSAASAGQTLTVRLMLLDGNADVYIDAATLSGSPLPASPIITSITPTSAGVGGLVTISGTGFGSMQGSSTVTFDGVPASSTTWGSQLISAIVPVGVQSGPVQVVTSAGASNTTVGFSLAPGIANLSPTNGPVGTVVTITGTSFGVTQGTGSVSFNGVAAVPSSWSDTQIVVTVPTGATTGGIVVSQNTVASSAPVFTVTAAPQGTPSPLIQVRVENSARTVNLSDPFNQDWIIWQRQNVSSQRVSFASTRKAGSNLIGDITPLNSTSFNCGGGGGVVFSWTGGTPTASGTDSGTGICGYTSPGQAGIQITAPADTTVRTLKIFSEKTDTLQLDVSVSDGSSPAVSIINTAGDNGDQVYSVDYRAASAAQTLTVRLVSAGSSHTVWVEAVVLQPHLPQVEILSPGSKLELPSQTPIPLGIDVTQFDSSISSASLSANGIQVSSFQPPNYTSTWTPQPGHYSLQAQATDAVGYSNTSNPVYLDIIGSGGALSDTVTPPASAPVDLMSLGTADWVMFDYCGDRPYTGVVRKAGVTPLISTLSAIGDESTLDQYSDGRYKGYSFGLPDGTPVAQSVSTACDVSLGNGVPGSGFELKVGADTTPRTLYLYTGALDASAKLKAFLSDGSAPVLVDVSAPPLFDSSFPHSAGVYAIHFHAASPGQTLYVQWVTDSVFDGWGTAELFAAALDGPPSGVSIYPTNGVAGSQASILGSGFGASQGANSVLFGGTTATVTSWTANEIDVVVPNLPVGNQVVTVPGVVSNSINYAVDPAVSGITPNAGSPDSIITIMGSSFGATQGGSSVTVGGLTASVTMWSDTQIQVRIPSAIAAGGQAIAVVVAGASSAGVQFTVTSPVVTQVSPSSGAAGTVIVISGRGFGASQGTNGVTIGGALAVVTLWSDTKIQALIPATAGPGTQSLQVVEGTLSTFNQITVEPSITRISPANGSASLYITIEGGNFGTSNAYVTFNGVRASVLSVSETAIGVRVPVGVTTGPVVVYAYNLGTYSTIASNGVVFTVSSSPTITGLGPTAGPIGTNVIINGWNFGTSGTVTFNGVPASPTAWGIDTIGVPVPAGATTGPVVVTVGGVASNSQTFTVNTGITGISPSQGGVGTSVTIAGTGFGSSQGSSRVTFNGTPATPSSWSDTSIVVPVPTGVTTGTVAVLVNSTSAIGPVFSIVPSLTSLSPASGPIGTQVTISGADFGVTQGTSQVVFGQIVAVPTQWSQGRIVVPVPLGATSASVGVVVNGLTSNALPFAVGATSVSGVVTDAGTGAPIPGVSVTALQSNATIASVTSAADGTYTISNLSVGVYDVRASFAGFGTSISSGISVAVGGPVTVNFALGSPAAIAGTITQSDGVTPISGATVTALNGSDTLGTAVTGSSGGYSVTNLGPGTYGIQVAAAGYAPGNQAGISVTSGNTSVANLSLSGQPTIAYTYDELGRLVGVSDPIKGTAAYSYDAVGNILSIARVAAGQTAILDFTPKSGPAGTVVTITGSAFSSTAQQDSATFSGSSAAVTSASSSQLVVTVPSGATSGPISVVTPNGTATSAGSFVVGAAVGAPVITSFAPTLADSSQSVTISGSGFDSVASDRVKFDGSLVRVTSATPTSITAVPGPSGHISVTTPGGTATSNVDFFGVPAQYTSSEVDFTGRINVGGSFTGTITTGSHIGLVLFDATVGQQLSLQVNGSTIASANVQIFSPGAILADATVGTGSTLLDGVSAPITGTYLIVVRSNGPSLTGNLTLNLTAGSSPSPSGSSITTRIQTSNPGQTATIPFNGAAGQLASVLLTNSTFPGCNSAVISILNPDGSTLTSGAMCGEGSYFLTPVTLPTNGTYTVVITPQNGVVGIATVAVSAFSEQTIAVTPPVPGTLETPVTISIPGQTAQMSFTGVAGQLATLQVSSSTFPSGCPSVTILNPDGSTLGSAAACASGNFVLNAAVLPANGTYTVLIAPQNGDTGSAIVSLSQFNEETGTISPGTPVTIAINSPGQRALLTFTGNAGQQANLQVAPLDSAGDCPPVAVSILNPNGSTLHSGYTCSTVLSWNPATLPANGTYTVSIVPQNSGAGVATVTLSLR